MAEILTEEMGKGAFKAVLHCFHGLARARPCTGINLGLYVSFSGIASYKSAQNLRDIAKTLPLERILIETDAPYLAPGKYRGKRNEPSYVVETAQVLADACSVSFEEFAKATTDNFYRLFSKADSAVILPGRQGQAA